MSNPNKRAFERDGLLRRDMAEAIAEAMGDAYDDVPVDASDLYLRRGSAALRDRPDGRPTRIDYNNAAEAAIRVMRQRDAR